MMAPPPIDVAGMAARHPYTLGDVDFAQPGDLYRKVMTAVHRTYLVNYIVSHLKNTQKRIQFRQTALFYKVDPDYGQGVGNSLGLDMEEVRHLVALSQEERVAATQK